MEVFLELNLLVQQLTLLKKIVCMSIIRRTMEVYYIAMTVPT